MQDRADSPPVVYIWATHLDSQRTSGECGVLERGTKQTILSQLSGSSRMLRSCLLGTLANPLSSFPWATEVLCAARVHSSGGRVCQPTPHSVVCTDRGCCELFWLLARAEPFSVACQQTLALLIGGLAQKHSKDHARLPTWFRAAAQG